jgi:trans-aconitate methyltransferase
MILSFQFLKRIFQINLFKANGFQYYYLPNGDLLQAIVSNKKGTQNAEEHSEQYFSQVIKNFKNEKRWKNDAGFSFAVNEIKALINATPHKPIFFDIGCYVGTLPTVLQHEALLQSLEYIGFDLIDNALKIARTNFPNSLFYKADIEDFPATRHTPDVVFTKGTLISTHQHIQALKSVLSLGASKVVLVHQPCHEIKGAADECFMVCGNKKITYTSSILSKKITLQLIKEAGYKIEKMQKRYWPVYVHNLGYYHLYDMVLSK